MYRINYAFKSWLCGFKVSVWCSSRPLQHLPLQESVIVHGVLVVFKWGSTQVVMNSPGQAHNTAGSDKTVTTEKMMLGQNLPYLCCFVTYTTWGVKKMRQGRGKTGESFSRQVRGNKDSGNSLAAVAEDLLTWTELKVLSALVCENLCYVYTLRWLHQHM